MTTVLLASAVADITPPIGFPMGGYGVDSPRLGTGRRRDGLAARVTALWFDGVPHVIVTCDVLGFGSQLHEEIRRRAAVLGVSGGRFVLTATHTHSGPALPEVLNPFAAYNLLRTEALDRYAKLLADAVESAVRDALSAEPVLVALSYRTGSAGFSYNREGLDHEETEVPVLTATDAAGVIRLILFGYAAHPVAADVQTVFDADYPGDAIAALADQFPDAHAQFLLGAAGDQNPRVMGGFDEVAEYGAELADAVAAAVLSDSVPVTGVPDTSLETVQLPLAALDVAAAEGAYRRRAADGSVPGFKRRHAQQVVAEVHDRASHSHVPLPLQVWRFPELSLVFSGGEVASSYAVHARRASDVSVWFTGYATTVPGYIPGEDLLDHSCYAGGFDADHAGIAGGSGTVYDFHVPFRSGRDGVEAVFTAALDRALR
jgi:hypothetical protein